MAGWLASLRLAQDSSPPLAGCEPRQRGCGGRATGLDLPARARATFASDARILRRSCDAGSASASSSVSN